jgi:hypothetical protein
MEIIESLLFEIEPLTALAIGVGAILLGPLVGAVGATASKTAENSAAPSDNSVGQAIDAVGETARGIAKGAVVWSLGIAEGVQTSLAEVNESWQDLVAEAKAEHEAKKQPATLIHPRQVEIGKE